MEPIADTPEPPYCAVVFTSTHTGSDPAGYADMAGKNGRAGRRAIRIPRHRDRPRPSGRARSRVLPDQEYGCKGVAGGQN